MRTLVFLLAVSTSFTASFAAPKPPKAEDLLKDADRARGGLDDGLSWEIDLENKEPDQNQTVHYVVKALDDDALVEATAPGRNKGETMLFNDRNLWFFKPGIKKPVAISPRQKLLGQAANGDIASTHYSRDYDAKIIGEESVDGIPCWKLELKAKGTGPTYDRIHYWVSKKDRVGIKADFFALSGESFKKASFVYDNKLKVDGKDYPFVSQMTIVDSVSPDKQTILKYQSPKTQKHAQSLFQVNNLVR